MASPILGTVPADNVRRLAICAMGDGSDKAPWNDKRYDCWGLNSLWKYVPAYYRDSITAWFEIHSRRYLKQEWERAGKTLDLHVRGLAYLNVPVYVQHPQEWRGLPKAQRFPREQIRRTFPRGDYHAGSIDWMLSYGLLKGYRQIELFGVALGPTDTGEPLSARACLEYWIGYAEAKGVKVKVHDPTGLFWIYNYTREKTPYHYDDTWRLIEPR